MAICEQIPTLEHERRRYRLSSPVDTAVLGEIECADEADVTAAVRRASQAQRAWSEVPVKERVRIVRRARALVVASKDAIMSTVMRETGKVPTDALNVEVFASANAMERRREAERSRAGKRQRWRLELVSRLPGGHESLLALEAPRELPLLVRRARDVRSNHALALGLKCVAQMAAMLYSVEPWTSKPSERRYASCWSATFRAACAA